jgi:hypothetical protein
MIADRILLRGEECDGRGGRSADKGMGGGETEARRHGGTEGGS